MPPDRWPSPLPGPAWQKWRNCWDYIETTVLAGVSVETFAVIRKDAEVLKAEKRAAQMAHSGDVLATNAACNAWVRALQAALAAHNRLGAA
jgi:hypothetical protein